ncbi:hypothetical protein CPK_ORF01082 [Chlamydia pneumoniae LPCoLN]|nr:hypothetical protein CPK_ORF01082 [Chlamydia pneumoniae LPCoLN]
MPKKPLYSFEVRTLKNFLLETPICLENRIQPLPTGIAGEKSFVIFVLGK